MSKFSPYLGISAVVVMAGCGGNQPQPTVAGGGLDPLASNGSLGTGSVKGNLAKKQPDLGIDSNLNGFKVFDESSFWNKDSEKAVVDPASDKLIAAIGADKPLTAQFGSSNPTTHLPFGTPYVVVSSDAPRVPIEFAEAKGSDAGPYPFPLQMPVENSKDTHAIVIDRDQMKLYEASDAKLDGSSYKANSGAVWDLRTYTERKPTQLSADPSGLPVFPGLVRFEEASDVKGINHVLRFTVAKVNKNFVSPATRSSGTVPDETLPPMGLHLRLKKSVKITKFPSTVQPILVALRKYGMVLSDTGADFGLSGVPDTKWIDSDLEGLQKLKASDFEVLKPPAVKGAKKTAAAITATATAPASTTVATPPIVAPVTPAAPTVPATTGH